MEGHLIVGLFAHCDETPDSSGGDWMLEMVCAAIAYRHCSARDKDGTHDCQSKSVVQAPESSIMKQLDLEREYHERILLPWEGTDLRPLLPAETVAAQYLIDNGGHVAY